MGLQTRVFGHRNALSALAAVVVAAVAAPSHAVPAAPATAPAIAHALAGVTLRGDVTQSIVHRYPPS